ncbi:UvrD-helicase domain-containing protein [uncultured Desulfobacter sp.]|uniref:UvrD-helicase domain-containing protein n=1 Tax=uncultured Desulfobacter sp. TaxID=240139 RepID=UPI002AABB7F3|nr:UvrD-helicase domain-containing protein [uncultured Desulfobacter sp.]
MKYIADLHIHSKYSRATAKNLDLENIYRNAQIKGITLVGTGDFTHPAWIQEIETKLEPAEPGLFKLKKELAHPIDAEVPPLCKGVVRFILQAEISNIYKKEARVRKNHNLIYMPDLDTAKKFNARLDAIGNIKSDGRPILGLDARNLLEIMLETSDQGFFVPAHIWTPWFSMFGSKSGFDTIEECFGDLSTHIFACETGLSSDPPMNWRVENLDKVRLISNSDAHSPGFLGRNASVFDTDLAFGAVRDALKTHDLGAYQGTLDMYPHQGKYHYDGHRKCGVCLNPDETAALGGICPECGKPLTLGVLYRVRELASRPEGFKPGNRHPHSYVVPLADILSQIFGVGPNTKKVNTHYDKAVNALGPELAILTQLCPETIENAGVPLLARAIQKMRDGDIHIDPGYDGEYGKVYIFTREEKEEFLGEKSLFSGPSPRKKTKTTTGASPVYKKDTNNDAPMPLPPKREAAFVTPGHVLDGLNPEQDRAVKSDSKAVVIQAGPGTGKTRTLTARIAWLLQENRTAPQNILALTFTNKAAGELSDRIESFIPQGGQFVTAATFHGFCLQMLKRYSEFRRGLMEEDLRFDMLKLAVKEVTGDKKVLQKTVAKLDAWISRQKQQLKEPFHEMSKDDERPGIEDFDPVWPKAYQAYDRILQERGLADFEDLIFICFKLFSRDAALLEQVRHQYKFIFVDEYQDLNLGQYRLIRLLAQKSHIFVIGDPDQSIYGFRGSDSRFFIRFEQDFPGCEQIRLRQNYRSTKTILDASFQVICTDNDKDNDPRKIYTSLNGTQKIVISETAAESAEAVAVGKVIEKGVGGLSFLSMDKGTGADPGTEREYAFSDFAVLYRTRQQAHAFARAFEKVGIPFQTADREHWADLAGIKDLLALVRIFLARGSETDRHQYAQFLPQIDRLDKAMGTSELLGILGSWFDIKTLAQADEKLATAWHRLNLLADRYPCPRALLDALRLDQDPDFLDKSVEKVSLMTIHAAKGLEFPVVFITGCENGTIPFARDGKTVEDPDEERRLFYVAMTRAKEMLYLTYARKRRIFGREQQRTRSCFIDDIEKELARYEKGKTQVKKQKPKDIQLELF